MTSIATDQHQALKSHHMGSMIMTISYKGGDRYPVILPQQKTTVLTAITFKGSLSVLPRQLINLTFVVKRNTSSMTQTFLLDHLPAA